MPTYEYKCPEGHRFELFQKMSEEPRTNCPECGAESERLLSGGAGFLFKGNGFYITDYRSESYKKGESKEKPGGAPETTPAKKAEKGGDSPSTSGKAKDSGSTSSPPGGSSPEGS